MRTQRIELEGRAGHVAIERPRGSTTIRIDSILRAPAPGGGQQTWKTWELDAHIGDDPLFKVAEQVQRRCDGVVGTNSMVHEYFREMQRFQGERTSFHQEHTTTDPRPPNPTTIRGAIRTARVSVPDDPTPQDLLIDALRDNLSPQAIAAIVAYLQPVNTNDENVNREVRWLGDLLRDMLGSAECNRLAHDLGL